MGRAEEGDGKKQRHALALSRDVASDLFCSVLGRP